MSRPLKLLLVEPFPIPYFAPLHRKLAARTDAEVAVAYASLGTTDDTFVDPGFGRTLHWDRPLLEGYEWVALSEREAPSVWRLIGQADVVVLFTYRSPLALRAWGVAILRRRSVIIVSDAVNLTPQPNAFLRPRVLRRVATIVLTRLADGIAATSSRSVAYYRAFSRRRTSKVSLVPYVADDAGFRPPSAVERGRSRGALGLPRNGYVVGFVGKFVPRKRIGDLLRAVAGIADAWLLVVGSGPQSEQLINDSLELGIAERTVFAGFANQSRLPQLYGCMDVLVLPSDQEPFGLVVHEAQLCGVAAVSTTECGAYDDLIAPIEPSLGYVAGDVAALRSVLAWLRDADVRADIASRSLDHAGRFTVRAQADALIAACEMASQRRRPRSRP